MTTATATAAVVALAGSAVALAAGDPTPDPPPRIAVVARGDGNNFADALAVGSVAGQLGAPVFTTPGSSLASATAGALAGYGPELVIITGGTAALSAEVEAAIQNATGLPDDQVVRAAGKDRFETAAAIAAILDDLDAAFLPVGATATDADLLDGFDSTAFLAANGKAADSDLLDGLDSGAFLTANGKATDSDLLDGLDASAFVAADRIVPFNVAFAAPGEETLATSGSLSLIATCDEGNLDGEFDGADQRLTIRLRSSADGWIESTSNVVHSAFNSLTIVELLQLDTSDPSTTTTGLESVGARSADGHYLGIGEDNSLYTVNHGGDVCSASGVAFANTPS